MTDARRLVVLVAIATTTAAACRHVYCECVDDVVGLVFRTDGPVTKVTLSGPACGGAHFRCIPADFDDAIHDKCAEVQIMPAAPGRCVVDLVIEGKPVHVERDLSERPKSECCGGYIGEANGQGDIDLRHVADASGFDLGGD